MEERSLFLLLLLRQPMLRMIYVTSSPVSEAVVEYYLSLLPGVIPRHARARLTMIALNDATPGSLSAKLLARPRILRDIRRMIPNRAACHLIPYNATPLERDVALTLGIPMYAADPRLLPLGTKTGCRRIFEQLDILYPVGAEDLHTVDDVVDALTDMRRRRPGMVEAIVKLNDGVSGSGNATVDLRGLPEPGAADEGERLRERVLGMALENPSIGIDAYLDDFRTGAGIVEERIIGERLTSPSVQMRALPDGRVELLSTHDQLLGGPSGQAYLGCIFPAAPQYAALIAEPALKVGRHLADLGVMGRFAVDFVAVQDDAGAWSAYAIELNLRKGGTTHPFLTLQFLTDGTYDGATGLFRTPDGRPKHLVATDHFEDDRLTALTVDDVFDIVARRRLHFDAARQTGDRAAHDQLRDRVRAARADRGRRHRRAGLAALRGRGPRDPGGGGVGAHRGHALPVTGAPVTSRSLSTDDPVWYVAYASNLCADRLRCYLAGGRPPGSRRTYQGGRDPSPPTASTCASTCRERSCSRGARGSGAGGWPSTTSRVRGGRRPRLPADVRAAQRPRRAGVETPGRTRPDGRRARRRLAHSVGGLRGAGPPR